MEEIGRVVREHGLIRDTDDWWSGSRRMRWYAEVVYRRDVNLTHTFAAYGWTPEEAVENAEMEAITWALSNLQ